MGCSMPRTAAVSYTHLDVYKRQAPDTLGRREESAAEDTSQADMVIDDLRMLAGVPILIYRRFETLITESFQKAGVAPHILCKNDDARTCLMWAEAGLGVAIVPASVPEMMGSTLTRTRIERPGFDTRIAAVCKKDGYLSDNARHFLAFFHV